MVGKELLRSRGAGEDDDDDDEDDDDRGRVRDGLQWGEAERHLVLAYLEDGRLDPLPELCRALPRLRLLLVPKDSTRMHQCMVGLLRGVLGVLARRGPNCFQFPPTGVQPSRRSPQNNVQRC